MNEYHKINTVWKRDERGNIMRGQFSEPELEYLQNTQWVFTEKVDGTNVRVMFDGETRSVRFGGKTDAAQMPMFLVERLGALFFENPGWSVVKTGGSVTLYGEGFGARIQKAGASYIPDGVDFILFDVLANGVWLRREDVEQFAAALGIGIVPILGVGTLADMIDLTSGGFTSTVAKTTMTAEGIVARPAVELCNRRGQRIITKIKAKDFLAKGAK